MLVFWVFPPSAGVGFSAPHFAKERPLPFWRFLWLGSRFHHCPVEVEVIISAPLGNEIGGSWPRLLGHMFRLLGRVVIAAEGLYGVTRLHVDCCEGVSPQKCGTFSRRMMIVFPELLSSIAVWFQRFCRDGRLR